MNNYAFRQSYNYFISINSHAASSINPQRPVEKTGTNFSPTAPLLEHPLERGEKRVFARLFESRRAGNPISTRG